MNDNELIKEVTGWEGFCAVMMSRKDMANLINKSRKDEKEKIMNFIGKLKINDEFHDCWKNEVLATGEDVLNNTLDMIIREIKEVKK